DAGVDVNPNQDDDHDDPRDEEVPNEPLPKALGLLVFLVVAHLAGHRSWAKGGMPDRKSTRLNSSHGSISYAVFCLKKKKRQQTARSLTTDNSWAKIYLKSDFAYIAAANGSREQLHSEQSSPRALA